MIKSLCLLGSTGSVGRQTVEVCEALGIEVPYLACGENMELLSAQIERLSPKAAAVGSEEAAERLRKLLLEREIPEPEILVGEAGRIELARRPSDLVLGAISGFAGLSAVVAALETDHALALANKESLVAGGELVMGLSKAKNLPIRPVDSEHSAIWQCLMGRPRENVRKIWLTCSGGPFAQASAEEMAKVTPREALSHPVWDMGAKISIDSATQMNKGLELIEAMWLFDRRPEEIEIVIHPEGLVHSLIEMEDGEMLAQLGPADMRLPIQLALTYPERVDGGWPRTNLFETGPVHFLPPDPERFPALRLAREAAECGGARPLVLNAANEVAVAAFLDGRLSFPGIPGLVERAFSHFPQSLSLEGAGVDDIIMLDREVRSWCEVQVSR